MTEVNMQKVQQLVDFDLKRPITSLTLEQYIDLGKAMYKAISNK